jgi:hypothetical protein
MLPQVLLFYFFLSLQFYTQLQQKLNLMNLGGHMKLHIRFIFLLLSIVGVGCSTVTKYEPMTDNGGYEDIQVQPGVFRVRVAANAKTPMKVATEYMQRRMGELCRESGYGYFSIGSFIDQSQSTVERVTDAHVQTNQFYGTAKGRASSYDVNHHFPNITGEAVCFATAKRPSLGAVVKMLTKEEAAALGVADGVGAVQVQQLAPDADNIKVEVGDILHRVNGKRVTSLTELLVQIRKAGQAGSMVSIHVLRESKPLDIQTPLITIDAVPSVTKRAPAATAGNSKHNAN